MLVFKRISEIISDSAFFAPSMTGPLFSRQFLNPKNIMFCYFICFCGFEVRADVILGGLQTLSGQVSKNFSEPLGIAQSFSYSSNFTLTGINLNLFYTGSTASNYTVSLYTNGLSGTRTTLGTGSWTASTNKNSSNVVSISGLNISMLMNTTYWIGVSTDRLGAARNWSTFNNKFGNGTSYTDTATTTNGTSWTTVAGSSANAMGMEILGTVAPVPEPGTLILSSLALSLGALCVWWKHRRNKPAGTNLEVC